jgi:hypothetical protein
LCPLERANLNHWTTPVGFAELFNSSPFHYIGAHALGFVGYDSGTNFYLLFYPSSTHVRALSQTLLQMFLLSPAELAWSRVISSANLTGIVQ